MVELQQCQQCQAARRLLGMLQILPVLLCSLRPGRGWPGAAGTPAQTAVDGLVPDLALQRFPALASSVCCCDGLRCQEGRDPDLDGLTGCCIVEEMEGQAPGSCPDVHLPGAGDAEGDAQVVSREPTACPVAAEPVLTYLSMPSETSQRSRRAAVPLEREMCVKVRTPGLPFLKILHICADVRPGHAASHPSSPLLLAA